MSYEFELEPSQKLITHNLEFASVALVSAHHPRLAEHVALHSGFDLAPRAPARSEQRHDIQRIHGEEVAVRAAAGRRAGAAVVNLHEVVHAGRTERADAWQPLGQFAFGAGDIVEHPVGEGSARRVGVIDDEHKALGLWRALPPERRRSVLAITGIFDRN